MHSNQQLRRGSAINDGAIIEMEKTARGSLAVEGDWDFGYLMPQISFREAIQNEFLALVPFTDERLIELADSCEGVRVLVRGLTDAFGRECQPSALLIRKNAPSSIDFTAVVDFRNAIAVSSLIDGMSLQLSGRNAGYPQWSDYFDFYSYASSNDGGNLIGQSLALTGLERTSDFAGQAAPHLPPSSSIHPDVDQVILDAILVQWDRKYLNKRSDRSTRVLFRSLQVASNAARLPGTGTRIPTIHDLGLSVATWVSAFEVLSHPATGNANLKTVLDCLEHASWMSPKLQARRYRSNYRGAPRQINFSQRIYTELYQARNDFLHGNRVSFKSLFPFKNDSLPSLPACSILVYRAALAGFLTRLPSTPQAASQTNLEAWIENSFRCRPYEEALENIVTRKTA